MPHIGVQQTAVIRNEVVGEQAFKGDALKESVQRFGGDADTVEISAVVLFILLEVLAYFFGAERGLDDSRLRRHSRF